MSTKQDRAEKIRKMPWFSKISWADEPEMVKGLMGAVGILKDFEAKIKAKPETNIEFRVNGGMLFVYTYGDYLFFNCGDEKTLEEVADALHTGKI